MNIKRLRLMSLLKANGIKNSKTNGEVWLTLLAEFFLIKIIFAMKLFKIDFFRNEDVLKLLFPCDFNRYLI